MVGVIWNECGVLVLDSSFFVDTLWAHLCVGAGVWFGIESCGWGVGFFWGEYWSKGTLKDKKIER